MRRQTRQAGMAAAMLSMSVALLSASVEKMPAEHFTFKPAPELMSYAEMLTHIVETQSGYCSTVEGSTNPGASLITLFFAQEPTGVTQQVFEISGQVNRIDRAGRTISITSSGVISAPIYVGADLPIFDQLNSGDLVTVRYYDSVIVEVTPGERMKPIEDTTAAAQKAIDRPDANILQQTRLVVTIDAVDVEKAAVTYHGVDNRRVFRVVRDRRLLEGVKPGDVVTITFTRAQAAAVTKAP